MADINQSVFQGIRNQLERFKVELANEFEQRVKAKHPPGDKTGHLRAAWKATVEPDQVVITNPMPYSVFIEYGTPRMKPMRPLARTMEEAEAIFAAAIRKAGIK